MTTWRSTFNQTNLPSWRDTAVRFSLLILTLIATLGVIIGRAYFERLGLYGYPAVLLISALGNAALFFPAPTFAVVLAAGGTLDPLMVGMIAGLGAALGEMTGFVIGKSGRCLVDQKPLYRRLEAFMRKSGPLAIFTLGLIPNPIFDLGGLIAGTLRMPAWHFLLAAWLGKSLRFWLMAALGAMAI